MTSFFHKHPKIYIPLGILLVVLLSIVYLRALYQPGIWHWDTFLAQQKDGRFAGSDLYADYEMSITPTDSGAEISFSVNGQTRKYRILQGTDAALPESDNLRQESGEPHQGSDKALEETNTSQPLEKPLTIYKDDTLLFRGTVLPTGNSCLLLDENGDLVFSVRVSASNTAPDIDELYPDTAQLYHWAVSDEPDIRGNPVMPIMILMLASVLILDLAFPNLFFALRYGLAVDGGEPSDWYRIGQMIGRIALAAGILICILMSFSTH